MTPMGDALKQRLREIDAERESIRLARESHRVDTEFLSPGGHLALQRRLRSEFYERQAA